MSLSIKTRTWRVIVVWKVLSTRPRNTSQEGTGEDEQLSTKGFLMVGCNSCNYKNDCAQVLTRDSIIEDG